MKTAKMMLLPMIVLALLLAACGGAEPASQATATPAVQEQEEEVEKEPTRVPAEAPATPTPQAAEPTATTAPTPEPPTPTPQPEPEEEDLPLSNLIDGLRGLDSYQSTLTVAWSGTDEEGKDVSGSWEMQEAYIRDPESHRMQMTTVELPGEEPADEGFLEIITVGDTSYMVTNEEGEISCISFSSDDIDPAEQAVFTPDMMDSVSNARFLGQETVNGVRTKHYRWKEGGASLFGVATAAGDVWLSAEYDVVIKYVAEATGKGILLAEDEGEGTVTVEYNVTEINSSFQIEPPAECAGPATDIPTMADAQDSASFGGMVSYSSPSAFADVVTFYKEEMPRSGWELAEGGMEMEGLAMLDFTKDGRKAQVMISYDEDAKMTSVVVTSEE